MKQTQRKCVMHFLSTWSSCTTPGLAWPDLRVCSLHRERVPLCSLEEGRPESHELGDHRAFLQCQRYMFVLFRKCMIDVGRYSSSWSVFNVVIMFPEPWVVCSSLIHLGCSLSFFRWQQVWERRWTATPGGSLPLLPLSEQTHKVWCLLVLHATFDSLKLRH